MDERRLFGDDVVVVPRSEQEVAAIVDDEVHVVVVADIMVRVAEDRCSLDDAGGELHPIQPP